MSRGNIHHCQADDTTADQAGIMEAIIGQVRWGENFVVEKQELSMQQ
ncbi:hypothetical protein [Nostoc sp. ChiQUE01b]|nr:hypothetical protein [Nostoc sp. ChiQUE01b]MDZ8259599.1 hypothetical protein [Nostoc sp. ChiQUE01b]